MAGMTTELPTPSTRPAPGTLTFAAPRRGKAPRHLADLDLPGRKAWAAELGVPGFRADQVSRHYFERLVTDPDRMTGSPNLYGNGAAGEYVVDALSEFLASR